MQRDREYSIRNNARWMMYLSHRDRKWMLMLVTTLILIHSATIAAFPFPVGIPKKSHRHQNSKKPSLSVLTDPNVEDSVSIPPGVKPPLSSPLSQSTDQNPNGLDWSFLHKAYIITCPNADSNSQRITNALSVLAKVGLDERFVEIKEFDTDDEDRIRGCYSSHISVIKDAIASIRGTDGNTEDRNVPDVGELWRQFLALVGDTNNANNSDKRTSQSRTQPQSDQESYVLIMEDNIEYNGSLTKPILQEISTFLSSPSPNLPNADMFHLAYIPYVPNLTVTRTPSSRHIVRLTTGVSSALGTTAYLASASALATLSSHHDQMGYYAAIPDIMAELFPESRYAANPVPFLRAPNAKSLVNPQLDDLRSFLFRPGIVRAAQGLLATTGLVTNTFFFVLIGVLVGTSGLSGFVTFDAAQQILTQGAYDGNIVLPVVSLPLTLSALSILAQGVMLAPKPQEKPEAGADGVAEPMP